jgi:hypothetical protein
MNFWSRVPWQAENKSLIKPPRRTTPATLASFWNSCCSTLRHSWRRLIWIHWSNFPMYPRIFRTCICLLWIYQKGIHIFTIFTFRTPQNTVNLNQ